MNKILIAFTFCLHIYVCEGQITFERIDTINDWTYAGPTIHSIIETPDHGLFGAGSIYQGLTTYYYWEKIDSTGHHQWGHQFGFWADSHINSICRTADNGFLLCGNSSASWYPMGIIKTDTIGGIEWYKLIGGLTLDINGLHAIQTKDRGYIIAGSKHTAGQWDAELIKLDSVGDYVWSKSYGSINSSESFNDIIELADSGFILIGGSDSQIIGPHIFLMRTNLLGDSIWSKHYQNGYWPLEGISTTKTLDSCLVIACASTMAPYYGSMLFKINLSGDTIWTKNYAFGDSIMFNTVKETNDSGFILSATKLYWKGILIKTNANGDIIWSRELMAKCLGDDAIQTNDNGYAIAGGYFSGIVKTDNFGNTNCTSVPGNITTSLRGLDRKFEAINILSDTLPTQSMIYYVPLDLDETMYCLSVRVSILKENNKIEIYPNPSTYNVTISSEIEIQRIEVLNSLGKLIDQHETKGQVVNVDIQKLPEGIYFLKATTNNGNSVSSFVKVK